MDLEKLTATEYEAMTDDERRAIPPGDLAALLIRLYGVTDSTAYDLAKRVRGPVPLRRMTIVDGQPLTAKIAAVLHSEDRIVITAGLLSGVERGDTYVAGRALTILDPDTGEQLGVVNQFDLALRVYEVLTNLSVCALTQFGDQPVRYVAPRAGTAVTRWQPGDDLALEPAEGAVTAHLVDASIGRAGAAAWRAEMCGEWPPSPPPPPPPTRREPLPLDPHLLSSPTMDGVPARWQRLFHPVGWGRRQ